MVTAMIQDLKGVNRRDVPPFIDYEKVQSKTKIDWNMKSTQVLGRVILSIEVRPEHTCDTWGTKLKRHLIKTLGHFTINANYSHSHQRCLPRTRQTQCAQH